MSMSRGRANDIRDRARKVIAPSRSTGRTPYGDRLVVHFEEMIRDDWVQELVVKITCRHDAVGSKEEDKVATLKFKEFYTADIVQHRLLDALTKVTT